MEEAVKRLKAMPDEELNKLGLERGKGRRMDPIVDVPGLIAFLKEKGWTEKEIHGCLAASKTKLAEVIGLREGLAPKYATMRVGEDFAPFIEKKESEAPLKLIKGL